LCARGSCVGKGSSVYRYTMLRGNGGIYG